MFWFGGERFISAEQQTPKQPDNRDLSLYSVAPLSSFPSGHVTTEAAEEI